MLEAIAAALTKVISMLGEVLSAVITADGAMHELLPVLAIGIGISVVMLTVRVIKSFAWGA